MYVVWGSTFSPLVVRYSGPLSQRMMSTCVWCMLARVVWNVCTMSNSELARFGFRMVRGCSWVTFLPNGWGVHRVWVTCVFCLHSSVPIGGQ
jgi:hypothetical protein